MKTLTVNRIKNAISEDAKKNLGRAFDVFFVKSDAPLEQVPVIDAASAEGSGILACLCTGERELYILTASGSRTEKEIDRIVRPLSLAPAALSSGAASALTAAQRLEIADVPDYVIWNLLLFALGTQRIFRLGKESGISNVNNALYSYLKQTISSKGKEEYVFVAFRITPEFVLRRDVATFTNIEAFPSSVRNSALWLKQHAPYFLEHLLYLRRRLVGTDPKGRMTLVLKKTEERSKKRNTVANLKFEFVSNMENEASLRYEMSKNSKTAKVMALFNAEYEKYGLSLRFETFNDMGPDACNCKGADEWIKKALGRFKGINIISTDTAEGEKAAALREIVHQLHDPAIPDLEVFSCDGGSLQQDMLNLVLVHQKELDTGDAYNDYPPSFCQHLTYEVIGKLKLKKEGKKQDQEKGKTLLKKAILEACVKDDNRRSRITLADTSFMPYKWVDFFIEASADGEFWVFGVRVNRTGDMVFHKEEDASLAEAEDYFRKYAAKGKASRLDYITVAYSEERRHINLIMKPAGLVVMPSVCYGDAEEQVRRKLIRRKSFKDQGGLNGFEGMSLIEIDGKLYYAVGMPDKNFQQSIPQAINFREIIREKDSNNVILDLFPMMTAPFVRLGQYSVKPMPLKYLREYAISKLWQEGINF